MEQLNTQQLIALGLNNRKNNDGWILTKLKLDKTKEKKTISLKSYH